MIKLGRPAFAVFSVLLIAGCSSSAAPDATPSPVGDGGGDAQSTGSDAQGMPTVKITVPMAGANFALTPDVVDIDIDFNVTNFTLVALGQEGTDMSQGQVRFYVDDMDCDDPGDGTAADPAVPYNRIYPNASLEKTIGMDYCAGGVPAIDNKPHTLKAQLFHGDTALTAATASDQISFHTTFSLGGDAATEGGSDGGSPSGDAATDGATPSGDGAAGDGSPRPDTGTPDAPATPDATTTPDAATTPDSSVGSDGGDAAPGDGAPAGDGAPGSDGATPDGGSSTPDGAVDGAPTGDGGTG